MYISNERIELEIHRENIKVYFHYQAYNQMCRESKTMKYDREKMLRKFIIHAIKRKPFQIKKILKEWEEHKMANLDHDSIMPFGKHKGKLICDIPSDYLRWAAREIDDEEIAEACSNEYEYRDRHNVHFWEKK